MRVNSAAIVGVEGAGQLIAGDFEANDVAMVPDPELAESELAQGLFALLDDQQRFRSHRAAVFNA